MYVATIGTCFTCYLTVGRPANGRLRRTARTNCRIYTVLPHDDGLLESPKHAELYLLTYLLTYLLAPWST
jgi:hypothetical protein